MADMKETKHKENSENTFINWTTRALEISRQMYCTYQMSRVSM